MNTKRLVLTWTKEQLDSYDEETDFVKMCLDEAAKVIGYMAIMNPATSVQWVGNHLEENKEAETISLYVDLNVFEADNSEYMARVAKENEKYDRDWTNNNE